MTEVNPQRVALSSLHGFRRKLMASLRQTDFLNPLQPGLLVPSPSCQGLSYDYMYGGSMTGMLPMCLHAVVGSTTTKGVVIRQRFAYEIQTATNIGDTSVRDIRILGSQLTETDDGLLYQIR